MCVCAVQYFFDIVRNQTLNKDLLELIKRRLKFHEKSAM